MTSRRRALLAAGFFVAVTACTGEPSTVLLRAEMHEEPLSGLRVLAYPFDPDRILDSLAARATRPRPRFPELERELAEYQPASDSGLRAASQPWRAHARPMSCSSPCVFGAWWLWESSTAGMGRFVSAGT